MSNIIGIDIGGTKTSVIISDYELNILHKEKFETLSSSNTLNKILEIISVSIFLSINPEVSNSKRTFPISEIIFFIIKSPMKIFNYNNIIFLYYRKNKLFCWYCEIKNYIKR